MSLGLVGSHRVGKTTLAEAVSQETDYPLVLTSTSAVFKKMGIDPAVPMTFQERMNVQDKVLDAAIEAWTQESGHFVTDRTPIDMIAYTLADVTGDVAGNDVDYHRLKGYIGRCIEATNGHFSTLCLIQPGIPIVEDLDKATAALNRSYMHHLNVLIKGLLVSESLQCSVYSIASETLDLDKRVRAVLNCVGRTSARLSMSLESANVH